MDCPACKSAMITLELADVEIDYCSVCKGIWLDSGELELLFGDSGNTKNLLASFEIDDTSSETPRKCPICLKKMQKVIASREPATMLIDKCPSADGLWFDRGELQQILKSAKLDKDNKIIKVLSDIFGG